MLTILSEEHLRKRNTRNLLYILRRVNQTLGFVYAKAGPRCCEICNEYIGSDWDQDVKQYAEPYELYKKTIKQILSTREHVDDRKSKRKVG